MSDQTERTGFRAVDIRVKYGRATALHGVNLAVPPKRVVALLGGNGAGKSSFVLAANGAVRSQGAFYQNEADISEIKTRDRTLNGLALVPQGRQLFPRMTVLENLRVFRTHLSLEQSVEEVALDRFPILRRRANALAGVLSGGEQQMLVVARALLARPTTLLLDEVVTGLAARVIDEIKEVISQLKEDGVGILIAAPELGRIADIVNGGYVIQRGRIIHESHEGHLRLEEEYKRSMGVTV